MFVLLNFILFHSFLFSISTINLNLWRQFIFDFYMLYNWIQKKMTYTIYTGLSSVFPSSFSSFFIILLLIHSMIENRLRAPSLLLLESQHGHQIIYFSNCIVSMICKKFYLGHHRLEHTFRIHCVGS